MAGIIKGTITKKQKDIGIYGRLVRTTTDSEDNSRGIVNISQVEGITVYSGTAEELGTAFSNAAVGDIVIVVEPEE